MTSKPIISLFILFALVFLVSTLGAQEDYKNPNKTLIKQLTSTDGFVALWQFNEKPGKARKAVGKGKFLLAEGNGPVERIAEGPVSGYSIQLDGDNFLRLSNAKTAELNIYGKNQGVTVVAWVKWTGEQTGFVGGMWNEYQDGGKRQYGLFVSLPYYNGANQVCGHISKTGRPTSPFPYSIDYSASKQTVPANQWCVIAFTYDGEYIKSFLNGKFEAREPELIDHTKGFDGYPDGIIQRKNPYHFPDGMGNNGSDFTVGAVLLKRGMGNFFKGQIGGLAVFNRALNEKEIIMFANKGRE
ncbi:LamG domain-containing protein [Maribellus sp. YY47]|uniref:LamG domain-containing protein n=1 Tax=Maribellus sp. YY47 TaxID=2929486 RepID=UPI0020019958|nr:LamG domain-containing protein [Maribellus sp. YY47]MCK3686040.1 LamG domain-containing protein [Maribellus sp. YY47]